MPSKIVLVVFPGTKYLNFIQNKMLTFILHDLDLAPIYTKILTGFFVPENFGDVLLVRLRKSVDSVHVFRQTTSSDNSQKSRVLLVVVWLCRNEFLLKLRDSVML